MRQACECEKPPEVVTEPTANANPWETDLATAISRIRGPVEMLRAATGHLLESSLGPFPGGKA